MPNILLQITEPGSNAELTAVPIGMSNWQAVTGLPETFIPENFIFTSDGTRFDSYIIETLLTSLNLTINNVSVEVVAGTDSDIYSSSVNGLLFIGGIEYASPAIDLEPVTEQYSFSFDRNPSNNNVWSPNDLTSVEGGVRLKSDSGAASTRRCAIDTINFIFFNLGGFKDIQISQYSAAGLFTFLSLESPLENMSGVIVDQGRKFLFISNIAGVYAYSYNLAGELTLLSSAANSDSYTDIVIDVVSRIIVVGAGINGLETYTYDVLGILTYADSDVFHEPDKLAMDTTRNIIFYDDEALLVTSTYIGNGTIAFADNIVTPTPITDIAIDDINFIAFVITETQLRSITYDAAGDLTDVDNISTNLTSAFSLVVDITNKLIIIADFSGNDLNTFSYDVAGNLTYIASTPQSQSPTYSVIDTTKKLFFYSGEDMYRSAVYTNLGTITYSDLVTLRATPFTQLVYLNINFSYAGELVSNVINSDIIHVNQDFSVLAEEDKGRLLLGSTEVKILYQKPDGTEGEIAGAIVDNDRILATVSVDLNNMAGKWLFKLYCELPGGEIIEGPIFYTNVVERWSR